MERDLKASLSRNSTVLKFCQWAHLGNFYRRAVVMVFKGHFRKSPKIRS